MSTQRTKTNQRIKIDATLNSLELNLLNRVLPAFREATVSRYCSGDLMIEEEGYGTVIISCNYPAKDRTVLVSKCPKIPEGKAVAVETITYQLKAFMLLYTVEEQLGKRP